MLKIAKENLNKVYAKIAETMGLFIPIKKGGEVNYHVWGEGKEVSLETLKTVKSPKNMFFPQTENMMKFKTDGKNIEVIDVRGEKDPFVLFGIKACDYKAIEVLDKVFLADPVDTYYQSRRAATTIVTLACSRPEESCFCGVFGIDATAPAGDATTWLDKEYLYFQAN
ncbi:MAG: 4Fe-4S ferredoxin, partial [Clostridia bacterium]|nr:4Fe-4S ferredoxin [Clostridia bacterium]